MRTFGLQIGLHIEEAWTGEQVCGLHQEMGLDEVSQGGSEAAHAWLQKAIATCGAMRNWFVKDTETCVKLSILPRLLSKSLVGDQGQRKIEDPVDGGGDYMLVDEPTSYTKPVVRLLEDLRSKAENHKGD